MKALAFLMVLTPLVEICARFNGYSAIAQKQAYILLRPLLCNGLMSKILLMISLDNLARGEDQIAGN